MYSVTETTTQPTDTITTVSGNELYIHSASNITGSDFPIVNMEEIPISNELLVENPMQIDNQLLQDSVDSLMVLGEQATNQSIDISVPTTESIEANIQSDVEMIHTETKVLESVPIEQQLLNTQVLPESIMSQDPVEATPGESLELSTEVIAVPSSVPQSVQFSPVKFNVTGSQQQQQPVFVNAVGGVQTGNQLANISYILPSSNVNKQAIVNKATSINMMAPNQLVANLDQTSNQTLITSTGSIVTGNYGKSQNLKLIQTSQGQQLVFSPMKPVSSATTTQVTIKPSTNQGGDLATKTVMAGQQPQQQQLIILSPVKTPQTVSTAKPLLPSTFKILPNARLPNIAPSTAKRIIAPATAMSTTVAGTVAATTTSSGGNQTIAINSIGTGKPIQAIVNPNNKKNIHYISFVPVSTSSQMSSPTKILPAQTKYVPLKPMVATKSGPQSNVIQLGQKVIINPNTIKISSTVPSSISSTATSSQQQSIQNQKRTPSSIWMVPKHQIVKMNETTPQTGMVSKQTAKYIPIAPNPTQSNNFHEVKKLTALGMTNKIATSAPTLENFEESRRKPCNCTRSQCLKLYCDCFANGEFCNNCNCVSCCNNLQHEEIRQKAIRLCLERNPNAFHPKIGQTQQGDVERRHKKGCCCKRSGCLKNYCECYEAKILCSDKCKCVGCKNFEESTERKTLMHLADAAEVRSAQQSAASKMHIWGPDLKARLPVKVKSDCHPFNIFTSDVLEATTNCLLAQAEEGEFEKYDQENIESLILDQFGECLSQMLNLSSNGIAEDSVDGSDDDDDADI